MSETPPEGGASGEGESPRQTADEAWRWLGEAHEELTVAEVLVSNEQLPARAACFHAHLAAEKALKALLLRREVTLKRSHDLALLAGMLDADDATSFDVDDLAGLNPWTIEGRYPADLADSASSDVKDLVAAARRVVAAAAARLGPE
jgi:HEPN domain-containing protein